jgi:hypothetical protein
MTEVIVDQIRRVQRVWARKKLLILGFEEFEGFSECDQRGYAEAQVTEEFL